MWTGPPGGPVAIAAVPYWNLTGGGQNVLAHRDALTEASTWTYGIADDGRVVPQQDDIPGWYDTMTRLRASGLRVVPTVANARNGTFEYGPVSRVLHDPAVRARHLQSLLALAAGYDGIDLDYEDLRPGDRAAFTGLVTDLAADLHAAGKTLSVDLFAKESDAGYDQRNVAQDYAALGRVVDQVRLMTYDYHWETSPPGPLAPVGWIRDVLAYARREIPPGKLLIGVTLSGYDWVDGRGTVLGLSQVDTLAASVHAAVQWDADSQAPWFSYLDRSGRRHEVWFENADSAAAKFALVRQFGIRGVFLWLPGLGDGGLWPRLRQEIPVVHTPGTPTPPSRSEGK